MSNASLDSGNNQIRKIYNIEPKNKFISTLASKSPAKVIDGKCSHCKTRLDIPRFGAASFGQSGNIVTRLESLIIGRKRTIYENVMDDVD